MIINASPIPDLANELRQVLDGDVRTDLTTRLLYSTDASLYQVEPLGVVFPRTLDDLDAAVALSARYGVPILARGSGSSLAGQAVGHALILDCSRYLTRLIEIDPQARTATFEPGLILTALNKAAGAYGLQFGPDPASADRATMGGSLANNATGAHSILYGMAADHLLSAEVILSDGSRAVFDEISFEEAKRKAGRTGNAASREAEFYRAALDIRERYADAIRSGWPETWRRASGYNLNYLLPWSPAGPPQWSSVEGGQSGLPYPPLRPGTINLAPLLAGSEGTLAVIRRATVRLVSRPRHTILGVLAYESIEAACDATPELLARGPSAVELIPRSIIQLARSVPAYTHLLGFVDDLQQGYRLEEDPAALLAVEFSGDDPVRLGKQVEALDPRVLIAESAGDQARVWGVRKVGLGILSSRYGDLKSIAIIEDIAVPVERLGTYVRELEKVLESHGTTADFYAHASAGCLHIRPLLNLKTPKGIAELRAIASDAVNLAVSLGGSVSGEHGDGRARAEWLDRMFGAEVIAAFKELKTAADPDGLLNPGKIVDPEPMDTDLRLGPDYQAAGWRSTLDFSDQAGLTGAIEQCNGAGVCRKSDGVMCPSFQATQEEMHSTRGRANLLRAMISGRFPSPEMGEQAVYEALDLCLACKGCKSECPSAVDVAKLKYAFEEYYYRFHRRPRRDYLFAYIDRLAQIGWRFARLVNGATGSVVVRRLAERLIGLDHRRPFPKLASRPMRAQLSVKREVGQGEPEEVLFLADAFTEFFYPQTGLAAVRALEMAGYRVRVLPVLGAGRTLISKGFLEPAQRHARQLLAAVEELDPERRLPVVGVEPSEIYTLRDEYLDLLPGQEAVQALAERAWMVDEFLVRPDGQEETGILRIANMKDGVRAGGRGKVLLHGHCYQKARPPAEDGYPTGVSATVAMLRAAGYEVELIDSGCCGMAGAFGYETGHYDVSMQVGELSLFPAVRKAGEGVMVAASGVSCQSQIEDGTGKRAVHPILLV